MTSSKKNPNRALKGGVRFNLSGLPGGFFKQTLPEELPPLALVYAGKKTLVRVGEKANVAPGIYTAVLSYTPPEEGKVFKGSVYSKPYFYVHTQVCVEEGVTSVDVKVNFNCFALVLDPKKCSSLEVRGYDGTMRPFKLMFGKAPEKVAYLHGNFSFPPLDVTATAPDGTEMRCMLVNDPDFASDGRVLVENGRWYSFNPAEKAIDFGEMSDCK